VTAQLLDELQQVVDAVKGEMQQALDARENELGDSTSSLAAASAYSKQQQQQQQQQQQHGGRQHGGGKQRGPSGGRIVAGHVPSEPLERRLRALQQRAPNALIACACMLADRSVARLQDLLASGEAAAAAANAAVAQMPRELKERRALMPWTMSPADAALASDGAGDDGGIDDGAAGRPDPDELIRQRQQAHVRLFLEARGAAKAAAAAQARLEALLGRRELAGLRGGDDGAGAWFGVVLL